MDLSPMNLQVMIPKATEVGQMQHTLNQQAAVQQDFEAVRQKTENELKQTQVRSREDVDGDKIKDDPDRQKRQGKYQMKKKRGQGNSEDAVDEDRTERMAVDTFRGQHIDIKL